MEQSERIEAYHFLKNVIGKYCVDETKESIVPFKFLKEELLIRHLAVSPGAGIQVRRDSMEVYLWNDILQLDSDKEKSKLKTKKLEKIITGQDEQYHNPANDLNYVCLEDCFDIKLNKEAAENSVLLQQSKEGKQALLECTGWIPYLLLDMIEKQVAWNLRECWKSAKEVAFEESKEKYRKECYRDALYGIALQEIFLTELLYNEAHQLSDNIVNNPIDCFELKQYMEQNKGVKKDEATILAYVNQIFEETDEVKHMADRMLVLTILAVEFSIKTAGELQLIMLIEALQTGALESVDLNTLIQNLDETSFDIFQAGNRARKVLYEKEAEYVKEIFFPYLNRLKGNKKEIFKEAVKTYFELALRETPENRQKLWDARIKLAAPMMLYYYGDEQKSEV